ncbi:hypothetical protein BDV12DRAFT_178823, partial [Aspergillus spectabilis]
MSYNATQMENAKTLSAVSICPGVFAIVVAVSLHHVLLPPACSPESEDLVPNLVSTCESSLYHLGTEGIRGR